MEELNQNEKIVWSCWETKTPREVVREAAAKGTHVGLAHRFLCFKQGWDLQTTQEWFNAEVFAWVLQLLSRKQYFKASHVLNKMQISPHKHMLQVAEEALDIELRDYIVNQLSKTATDLQKDSPDDWKVFINNWNFLKILEKSFETDGTLKQHRVFGTGKNLTVITSRDVKSLTIEKIQKYSEEWKRKIATYLFLEMLDFSIVDFVDSDFLWKICLQQNKAMLLKRWISMYYLKERNFPNESLQSDIRLLQMDIPSLDSVETLKQLDKLFASWTINTDMMVYITECDCYKFTKLCVYDTLCIFGHIIESEKENLQCILSRLSRTQSLGNTDKLFSRCTSTIKKSDFNNMLAKYCVNANEYHALTTCVDFNLLDKKQENDQFSPTTNCLDLWVLFKDTANTKEINKYILSIYEACRYISHDSVDKYLSDNPILILAMVVFEGKIPLFEIFNEEQNLQLQNFQLNWDRPLNRAMPHLYSVYERFKNESLVIENDVNVYQLLSGYKGLDISKIFEFQLIEKSMKAKRLLQNKLLQTSDIAIEHSKNFEEMPHFSNRKYVRKYGFQNKLNYMYYLKQNRPCMASQALLIQQYQRFGRLSAKIIQQACTYSHTLALQNWDNLVISASCIAFISMIGGDSIKCRTHVTCAQLIAAYFEAHEYKLKDEVYKDVSTLMERLIMNDRQAQTEILQLAEKAVTSQLVMKLNNSAQPYVDVPTVLQEWQSVIKFACFHNLPLPTPPLQVLVNGNLWIQFLIFGDVFKYSKHTMLSLSQDFSSDPLVEHIRHAIANHVTDESVSKEVNKSKDELRKTSRDSLQEVKNVECLDFSLMSDIWEVMACCHGPEDPPGALLKASASLNCPILALIATCYEPDAVEICWAQWLLSNLKRDDANKDLPLQGWDFSSHMRLTDKQVQALMEICLETGYYKTLYESLTIFHRESSLCELMKFIMKTVLHFDFGLESLEMLKYFNDKVVHRVTIMGQGDGYGLPRLQKPRFVQTISVSLIIIALSKGLKSTSQQKAFLQCLCETQFSNDFIVPHPDFCKIATLLNIATECNIDLDLGNMCRENAIQFQNKYIENLIKNNLYDKALQFAEVVELPIEHILIAEWIEKYNSTYNSSENNSQSSNEQSLLKFWTQCSLTFKKANANPMVTIEFLKTQCNLITETWQKFYMLRLILGWFYRLSEDAFVEMSKKKDEIELEMWISYLSCESENKVYVLSDNATYDYILTDDMKLPYWNDVDDSPPLFYKLLSEIEQESNISNMSITGHKLNIEEADKWHRAIGHLLETGLLVEAWRLSKMFSAPPGYVSRPLQSLDLVETCLRLAEGTITPYEMPQNLRIIVTLSSNRRRLSDSECSDHSFEELVLITDKQEDTTSALGHLAGRQEADCLSTLETLASRSGLKIVKQVTNIYRISLQIGWPYDKVLKYDGSQLDLINYLSGRSRMPLAKIIFRTYEIPTQKIVEYLCLEIVGAVISPHLTRTSGFRQKEHFRYTLWGYPLDSDFEMFLNLRPDDNSTLGRMIIEHLSGFRRLYKTDVNSASSNLTEYTEVDDVDVILDEEYQNIKDDEVESVISQQSVSTVERLPYIRRNPFDSQSIISASTVYNRSSLREKKPQFDVISCINVRIKSSVKSSMKLLLKGAKLSSKQVNVISIELLVLAHECFSSVCDTEGIATVLRSAQTLSSHLLAARSWRLMVRLLTGLARYTEMAYIFQMLRDNHQFEFLLGQFDYMMGQQEDKITSFKQGLLDFLKNHCPGDSEVYCLVALHFSMYSEAADVKKKQANNLIVTLVQIALDSMKALKRKSTPPPEWIILANSDSNRLLLDTAINHSSDSAELYSKAGCLGAAREMAGLAQLLALQISLLNNPPTKCILNLSQEKMVTVVDSYLSFMEGLVFALACDGGGGGWMSRWREIVYQRVLRGNDLQFVKDIAAYRPDIACYVIERFDNEKINTGEGELAIAELRVFFK